MSDHPAPVSVTEEIERQLSTIWQRRCGVRPVKVSTEVDGDVIRCVIQEGELEEKPDSDEADESLSATEQRASIASASYRHEASAAVAKITRRPVASLVAKHDAKTGRATQSFILKPQQVRY